MCRRLTWVTAVTSMLLRFIDPIDHSFPNPLLLISTVLSTSLLQFSLNSFSLTCIACLVSVTLQFDCHYSMAPVIGMFVPGFVWFVGFFLSNTLLFIVFSKRVQNSTLAYPWINLVKQHSVSLDIYIVRGGCYWNQTNK